MGRGEDTPVSLQGVRVSGDTQAHHVISSLYHKSLQELGLEVGLTGLPGAGRALGLGF